ncbi:MAG TPA: TatD family hydrolase, partial [Myxococcaceae bacterium]|nr:TatD family hydrolase [Myxococcaceae bacterium]
MDTHCHLDVSRFDADRAAVLDRAWAAGVEGILVPAIGPEAWDALLRLPPGDGRIQVALGIH